MLPHRWLPSLEAAPDEASWRDAWRAHADVVEVGSIRLWPSWWDQPAPPFDGVTVLLDPGWAFGSGSHPSTRMALRTIGQRVPPGNRVLDLGCGSGVLAVAAALLGAGVVVAVDVDPEARRATADNARANGVDGQIEVTDVLAAETPPFELVVANIGAAVLTDLAPVIVAAVADGGVVVLGGLLVDQAPAVVAIYGRTGAGLRVVSTDEEDGWTTLVLGR
jgi:ribosomal protein L11 methyltransferase